MCFSAQIVASYHDYCRVHGATLSLDDYVRLYQLRSEQPAIRIPRAMDRDFDVPDTDPARKIRSLIEAYDRAQVEKYESEVFKQRRRLADAERALQTKTTKAATESRRIAGDKISKSMEKLADLRRTEIRSSDSRIFPGWYAPVLIVENGRRVVKPMRYQCRPAGKPANYDIRYPGTYNARRDNLEGFWRRQFGHTHGIVIVSRFYENVARHAAEGRELAPGEPEQNVVLEFRPDPRHDMLVACLWSRWTAPGEPDLYSFAAITDEPPPEVRAAGHDRCIVPIKAAHLEAWLNPDPRQLRELYRILDDRERPYYEHRMAA